jgi:hypothetical protein
MTSPGLPPWARPVAAVGFREPRRRLAYVRQQEQELPPLRSFQREAARTCERLRRETRLQLQAMRQLLPPLFDEASNDNGPEDGLQATPLALVLISHERTRAHVRYTITGTAASEFVPTARWPPLPALPCAHLPRQCAT